MNISIVIRLKITNIRQAKTSKAQRKRFLTPTVKSSCLSASEWCDAPTLPGYNWSGRVGWGRQTDGHLQPAKPNPITNKLRINAMTYLGVKMSYPVILKICKVIIST